MLEMVSWNVSRPDKSGSDTDEDIVGAGDEIVRCRAGADGVTDARDMRL